jgi:hypothetical protein
MPKSVAEKLKSATLVIGGSGADHSAERTSQVDKGLDGQGESYNGGYAPAFVKAVGHHVNRLPGMFGKKNMGEILGQGDLPKDGAIPAWVHPSINLRDRKSFRHINEELKELLLDFKKDLHNAEIQRQIMVHEKKMPYSIEQTPYFKHVIEPKLKAYNLTDFSAWVPTLNTSFYFEELDLDPVMDRYFPEYFMPSKTVTVPGTTGRLKGRLETDAATFTAQYQTQASFSLVAQDCVAHTDITEDLLADMIPNASAFERLRREAAMGVQRSKEDAIINGDDSITTSVQGDGHMDSDIAGGAATLFNKAFKGLRKRALAASVTYGNGGAAVSLSTYNGLIPLMGKFAKEKGDLLIVLGPTIANKIITGGVPELLTHDKVGPSTATISTGILPKIFGIEQYESEWVREDVNASGVYASSQVLTTMLLVKKSRFVVGKRAPLKIWATPSLASSDKLLLSAKERFSFGGNPQSASEVSIAAAINIALT